MGKKSLWLATKALTGAIIAFVPIVTPALSQSLDPDPKFLPRRERSAKRSEDRLKWQGIVEVKQRWSSNQKRLVSLAFSPDSKSLALGIDRVPHGDVRIVETASGKEVIRFTAQHRVGALRFSPNGNWLAVPGELPDIDGAGVVTLYDTTEWRPRITLRPPLGVPGVIAFSPDGKILASNAGWKDREHTVVLWHSSTGKLQSTLKPKQDRRDDSLKPSVVDFVRPDQLGQMIQDETFRNLFYSKSYFVRSLAFSPDGKTLAVGESQGTLRLWDWKERKEIAAIEPAREQANRYREWSDAQAHQQDKRSVEFKSASGHPILGLDFSPDGRRLAISSTRPGLMIYALPDQKLLCSREAFSHLGGAAFSPEGKLLLAPTNDINLWDAAQLRRRWAILGHRHRICSMVFSRDGKLLATADLAGTVKVWDWQMILESEPLP